MLRRDFMQLGVLTIAGGCLGGCRGNQYAKVMHPGESGMVGSHQAGEETFRPLIDEAVAKLLGRQAVGPPPGPDGRPRPMRICFVAVENQSAEEIGDFKDQIYQQIDSRILQSQAFQPVSKRFVDAGLMGRMVTNQP